MRPQILFPLFADVRTLPGVGPKIAPLVEPRGWARSVNASDSTTSASTTACAGSCAIRFEEIGNGHARKGVFAPQGGFLAQRVQFHKIGPEALA